ncbi:Membrane protein TMS1 [Smittium mucronatum]|uniref:Membrane protein TMS1 n=1 Tax=Smittium mucronatum TaxID=133383 RepID=A0A1R0GML4_9FUNG|nr:Membrane protein TMS1 [Smittium mucronatum]
MTTNWGIEKLKGITFGLIDFKCAEDVCYGIMAVHRVCFSQSLFHAILGACVYGINDTRDKRSKIQNEYWGTKLFLSFLLLIMSFFIPNGFFKVYGDYISTFGAAIFIFIQLVLLIDFTHNIAEYCIESYEDTLNDNWKYLLVGGTSIAFLAFFVITTLQYVFFGKRECGLNQFFITFNVFLCIIASFLAIHPRVQEANSKSGLAQAAMVTIYSTYLVSSALIGEPVNNSSDKTCNPLNDSAGTRTTLVVLGAIFTVSAICYSTSTAATKSGSIINSKDHDSPNLGALKLSDTSLNNNLRTQAIKDAVAAGSLPESALINVNDNFEDDDPSTSSCEDDERHGVQYSYSFFHFIFCVAAMYMSMLLTNWNSIDANSGNFIIIGRSMSAVWAKVISSWLCIIMYSWTLVGPVVYPDRY